MKLNPWLLLATYSVAIVAMSLLGAVAQMTLRLTHTRMQVAMSFVAGLVLGVALYHLLPHALARIPGPQAVATVVWWTTIGMIAMVLLLRVFPFHRHDIGGEHDFDHSHHDHHGNEAISLSWLGMSLGMGLHTLAEGGALGASVRSSSHGDVAADPVSVALFLAILFHKPLDTFTILGLMRIEGVGRRAAVAFNMGITLLCPLGAFLAFWGIGLLGPSEGEAIGRALAFGAGALLCVSLSDLLPEIHFHVHDRLLLTSAFLLGITVAYGLHLVEQMPLHGIIP